MPFLQIKLSACTPVEAACRRVATCTVIYNCVIVLRNIKTRAYLYWVTNCLCVLNSLRILE